MYINVNDQVGVSINVTRIVKDKASFPSSRGLQSKNSIYSSSEVMCNALHLEAWSVRERDRGQSIPSYV